MGRTIKNGRFCIYNGNEFKVNKDSDGNTIILTKNDKIIDSTFIDKYGSGVYSKKVSLEEIEELASIFGTASRIAFICAICSFVKSFTSVNLNLLISREWWCHLCNPKAPATLQSAVPTK